MSDTVDLTLLSGQMRETARDLRLLRLQTDTIAARLSGVEARLGTLEQGFHGLIGELGRGFGQQEQLITRLEQRLDALDGGLTSLRADLADSTERLLAALRGAP